MFEKLQSLEFMSIMASTIGAAKQNNAILCNGANLTYERNFFLNAIKSLKFEIPSGEDMFLLEHAKKIKNKKIECLNTHKAIVYTEPISNYQEFKMQRQRWTSKNKLYKDKFIKYTAIIIFLCNIQLLLFPLLILLQEIKPIHFLIFFSIKMFFDFNLNYIFARKYHQTKKIKLVPLLYIIYPIYLIWTVFSSLKKKYEWKKRNYNL